jgi:hypothetical protein
MHESLGIWCFIEKTRIGGATGRIGILLIHADLLHTNCDLVITTELSQMNAFKGGIQLNLAVKQN